MKVRLTRRRVAVLEAIHENGEALPSTICHATNLGPGTIYPILDLFERVGWINGKPHPTRPGARLYHLTLRGQTGSGLQQKEPSP